MKIIVTALFFLYSHSLYSMDDEKNNEKLLWRIAKMLGHIEEREHKKDPRKEQSSLPSVDDWRFIYSNLPSRRCNK